jgi:hypothetical protein
MPGMTATILPFPTRVARWERKPAPHPDKNIGAEMIVIGSIIRDWQNYFRAAPIIASRHFADLSHAELYRRIEVRIDAEFSVSVGAGGGLLRSSGVDVHLPAPAFVLRGGAGGRPRLRAEHPGFLQQTSEARV